MDTGEHRDVVRPSHSGEVGKTVLSNRNDEGLTTSPSSRTEEQYLLEER